MINSTCTSTQNASFHGSSTHNQYTQQGFHAKAFPAEARNMQDSGKARTTEAWEKSARKTRMVSPLSPTAVLGGRHEKIFPEQVILSQACNMLKRSAAPVAQQSFRIKQMDSLFQLGDSMGDYIPKTCSNCKKCSTCTFAGIYYSEREDSA